MDAAEWLNSFGSLESIATASSPVVVTARTVRTALQQSLTHFTHAVLDQVLGDELKLTGPGGRPIRDAPLEMSKRDKVGWVTEGWDLDALVALARRVSADYGQARELTRLVDAYDERHGGVAGEVKNLIFAADGPKPELVLADALSNRVKIVRHAEHCLVYDRPLPSNGLTYAELIEWWRVQKPELSALDAREVGLDLHARLRASLDSEAEQTLFDVYNRRYKSSFEIPALVPQVYLHYDPYTVAARVRLGEMGSPLARQRMDFLLLFSARRRVVLEVDGKQHYSNDDGAASPSRYAGMVREDRRLRQAGYEVYRFGGSEFSNRTAAASMLDEFFDELAS